MPSKMTRGKSPVGNFSFDLTNPSGMVGTAVQATLGLTFLILVAGFAWNNAAPWTNEMISSLTGGRVNPGRPASGDSASIEVV